MQYMILKGRKVEGVAPLIAWDLAALSGVERHESGLASGLVNTSQQVGGALGLAVLVSVASTRTEAIGADASTPAAVAALTEGFQAAFLGSAGFALVAALAASVLLPRTAGDRTRPVRDVQPPEYGVGAGRAQGPNPPRSSRTNTPAGLS